MIVTNPELAAMAHLIPSLTRQEKPKHALYLNEFRTQQCPLFLEHKCQNHRPYTCFHWHFPNQKRRQPIKRLDGTFNYNPDVYCTKYDENTGVCPNGNDCPYVHRNAGDTERRYHPRYFKTGNCIYETTDAGACVKNGQHCAFAHGADDIRLPVYDIREVQDAAQHSVNLPASLEKERVLSEDPKWNDMHHVLAHYKTEPCKKPPRMCRQGYACPFHHNGKDKRRNPQVVRYRSTPCPAVKPGDEWKDSGLCEAADGCQYCHTRTEQQFHPEIYKSTKCNDMLHNGYCPRGPFCAFAHVDSEMTIGREFISTSDALSNQGSQSMTGASSPTSGLSSSPNLSVTLCGSHDTVTTCSAINPVTSSVFALASATGLSGLFNLAGATRPLSNYMFPGLATAGLPGVDVKGRHMSGGSLSSESGLSSSSARGDTPPFSYAGSGSYGNGRCQRRSLCGLGLSEETNEMHVESILGQALGDSYSFTGHELGELNNWPDDQPNEECLCADVCWSSQSTLRSAPVSIPPRYALSREGSSPGGSSGLGGSFPCLHQGTHEQTSVGSMGFTPTRSRCESGSPNSGTHPQTPIFMPSPFSNASSDLERLALQRELEDCRRKLTSTQEELKSTKKERDTVVVQLQDSIQLIRSLINNPVNNNNKQPISEKTPAVTMSTKRSQQLLPLLEIMVDVMDQLNSKEGLSRLDKWPLSQPEATISCADQSLGTTSSDGQP